MLSQLVGCATQPAVVQKYTDVETSQAIHRVYIVRHSWHTGVVVQARDLNQLLPALRTRFGTRRFYEAGWGDEAFYQAARPSFWLTFKAAMLPSNAVLHLVGFDTVVEEYFAGQEMARVHLSEAAYQNLIVYLYNSFQLNKQALPHTTLPGQYGDSQFYQAVGTYTLFNTCNTWTAKALASAGFDISTRFSLTTESIMGYLRSASTQDPDRVTILNSDTALDDAVTW